MVLLVLPPGSSSPCAFGHPAAPQLGSVYAAYPPYCAREIAELRVSCLRFPWVPPAFVLAENDRDAWSWPDPVDGDSFCVRCSLDSETLAEHIRLAARKRPIPTGNTIAEYVGRRVPGLQRMFLDALQNDPWQQRRVRASLHRAGKWTAHDCRGLVKCVQMLALASRPDSNQQSAADAMGIDRKTASHWVRSYLRLDHTRAIAMLVWEAWTEQALRHNGYCC